MSRRCHERTRGRFTAGCFALLACIREAFGRRCFTSKRVVPLDLDLSRDALESCILPPTNLAVDQRLHGACSLEIPPPGLGAQVVDLVALLGCMRHADPSWGRRETTLGIWQTLGDCDTEREGRSAVLSMSKGSSVRLRTAHNVYVHNMVDCTPVRSIARMISHQS